MHFHIRTVCSSFHSAYHTTAGGTDRLINHAHIIILALQLMLGWSAFYSSSKNCNTLFTLIKTCSVSSRQHDAYSLVVKETVRLIIHPQPHLHGACPTRGTEAVRLIIRVRLQSALQVTHSGTVHVIITTMDISVQLYPTVMMSTVRLIIPACPLASSSKCL